MTGHPRHIPVAAVVAGLVAGLLAGCGGSSGGGYQLTATFDRTVGLYEGGDVQVMGMAVGFVDELVIDGTQVQVTMTIDDEVPLPKKLFATVGQTQLIGERNVVLYPPWNAEQEQAGAAKAADGDVIPAERTVEPVEPDEALAAFDNLARSLEGDVVNQFVSASADVLEGRGETLGRAIDQAAGLSTTLAEVDEQLVSAADNLHVLASSLAGREQQIGTLVDAFSQATDVLASEREGIRGFLSAMVALTEQGTQLLDTYGSQLPGDLATVTALASILARNTNSIDQLLTALPILADGFIRIYDPKTKGLALLTQLSPTGQAWAAAVVDQLGAAG